MDRNEVIKEIEELLNGYPVFIPEAAKRGLSDALALLKDYDTQLQYRDDHIAEYKKEIKRLEGLLKEQEPVETEIEGGGSTWYYVCGDCHGVVGDYDNYCRHCGRKLKHD